MQDASPRPSIRDRNRIELLEIAERLFATNGIEGVSLRQIGTESGRRNPASVQYHFGSKAELLRAILEHRLPAINSHRLDLLDRYRKQGRERDLRALVEAMVRPLLDSAPQARYYVPFLARLIANRGELRAAVTADLSRTGSARLTTEGITSVLGHIPPALREQRVAMATSLMVHEIAGYEESVAAGRERGVTRTAFAGDLVDAMVGLLSAPHTPVEDTEEAHLG